MLRASSRQKLELELFPFISLFLCVIGVLAFLQNLMVMGELGASEEEASQPQIFQTAYRIECFTDRLVLHPPTDTLDQLYQQLTLEEQTGLDVIIRGRANDETAGGAVLNLLPKIDEDYLTTALNEIVTINQLADTVRLPYEEYVLFDIHSGGSDLYHYVNQLLDIPEYRSIRAGLDITDTGVTVR